MTHRRRLEPALAARYVMHALGGRISIPLAAVRSRLADFSEKVSLDLETVSPGLRVRGDVFALGAPIDFSVRIDAEGVHVQGERRTVRLRLSEVELTTDADAPGPLAEAIRSGMIDTANPATLIGNMMTLPDMIVEAKGSDIVLDLMRFPAIARSDMLRASVAAATSYVGVTGIGTSDDAIELRLGLLPGGLKEAALGTARAALTPVVRYLWPDGQP